MSNALEFPRGTLDLLVLKAVSGGAVHGYGIRRWIEQHTENVLQVDEGALYPALHKLEGRGLVVGRWGLTELNRRGKLYRITTAGRKQLRASHANWARFTEAVTSALDAPRPGGSFRPHR